MQLLQDYVIQNSNKSKKTTYFNAYKIFTLVGLFYIAIYRTFVFQHSYIRMHIFYVRQRIKYGHGMRIFQAFIKKIFA